MKVVVTGATGFVGRHVVSTLSSRGETVIAAIRSGALANQFGIKVEHVVIDRPSNPDAWMRALEGQSAVIHLIGLAHIDNRRAPIERYRQVNVGATKALLAASTSTSVERIVYISSVKASGKPSDATSLTESTHPVPHGPYGASKLEAEAARLGHSDHVDVTILRPPLVYEPGVRANFLRLMNLACKGRPSTVNRTSRLGRRLASRPQWPDSITIRPQVG